LGEEGVPVGITVAVVVAEEVVTASLGIVGHLEGLIDHAEQLLGEVGDKVDETRQVVLDGGGRHTPHQIQRTVELASHYVFKKSGLCVTRSIN
jgi:hypothetical protein